MKTRILSALALVIPYLLFADCAPTGLVAMWKGESNILDSVGGYDGSSKGAGVTYTNAEVGKGFSFSGTSTATIDLGTFLNYGTSDFTVEFWIKTTNFSTSLRTEIMSKRASCDDQTSMFDIQLYTNGAICFNYNQTGRIGYIDVQSATTVVDGQFHHVACVRQGTNALIYIDSYLSATQNPADAQIANISNTTHLKVGMSPCITDGFYNYFKGCLDEISIYTNALSASDVLAIYQDGTTGKCCWLPNIITDPVTPQNVHTNSSTTFTVTALGGPSLSYQWRLNTTNVAGATSSAYPISSVQTANLGTYDVIVSTSCGAVTSDGTSVLAFAPIVTTQPANATGVLGAPAYFTAVVGGSPTIAYSWRKNGTTINDGATYTGTKTTSLTITSVVGGNTGSYSVHVSNDGGATNSATTSGILAVPPDISAQPTSKSGFIGGSVTFTVTASGSPTLHYLWQSNGIQVTNITASSYTVSNISSNWHGNVYSVLVSNLYGVNQSSNATLSVEGTVLVDIPAPLKTTNCLGETRTLCVTGGAATNTPSYQWKHNTTAITGATDSCYTVNVTGSSAAGSYSVVVSDSSGSDTSSTASIVYSAPVAITLNPTSQTVLVGQPAFFNGNATGFAPVSFSWMKDGVPIPYTLSNYIIAGAALSDVGTYYFQAANYCGYSNSSTATLTVNTTNCAPNLLAGLTAWWQFESNALDFTSNYNGTASGVTYPNGEVNLGMKFDGSTAQTNYFGTDVGTFGTNDFTVELWIATTNSSPMCVMDKRVDCDADFKGWEIHMGYDPNNNLAPGKVGFGIIAGGFASYGANASRIDDGGFHHVALVRSNVVASMYVDGTVVTNITMPVLVDITNSVPLKIGRSVCEGRGPAVQRFTGLIDEITFYNRPLSPVEISSIYNAWGAGKCTGP